MVTGVSGSGKSTLVHDVLYAAIKRAKGDWDRRVGACDRVEGIEHLSDVVLVDQAPIGRTPRSNPVTYLKAFDAIRDLFAATKDARIRGLTPSHFSFNVPGGRCEACEGEGQVRVEMQFLADVFVPCDQCEGKRFRPQVLEVRYKQRNIDDVLALTVREAHRLLRRLARRSSRVSRCSTRSVSAISASGSRRRRCPAAKPSGSRSRRTSSPQTGERMLYILDEPTTGLHFDDIAKLLTALRKLLQAGHSLLVIEHNLDVIKCADWVLDLGPEGRRCRRLSRRRRHARRHCGAARVAHRPTSGRDPRAPRGRRRRSRRRRKGSLRALERDLKEVHFLLPLSSFQFRPMPPLLLHPADTRGDA